jgi:hypothetical protein
MIKRQAVIPVIMRVRGLRTWLGRARAGFRLAMVEFYVLRRKYTNKRSRALDRVLVSYEKSAEEIGNVG